MYSSCFFVRCSAQLSASVSPITKCFQFRLDHVCGSCHRFLKLSERLTFFLKKKKKTTKQTKNNNNRAGFLCPRRVLGEESPGANQGQNDAAGLHRQSRPFSLRGSDRGLSWLVPALAPLKLYNYQQAVTTLQAH